MLLLSFARATSRRLWPGRTATSLDPAPEPELRPLPLVVALMIIGVLSLALWAGVAWLFGAFSFGYLRGD